MCVCVCVCVRGGVRYPPKLNRTQCKRASGVAVHGEPSVYIASMKCRRRGFQVGGGRNGDWYGGLLPGITVAAGRIHNHIPGPGQCMPHTRGPALSFLTRAQGSRPTHRISTCSISTGWPELHCHQRLLSFPSPPAPGPEQDAPLLGSDPVVWYSFGVTHVVRPEDFPIMPVEVRAGGKGGGKGRSRGA